MSIAMPREQDPEKGRFGQPRPLQHLGEIEGSGYEAIVLERLAKHACRIAGVERGAIFVRDRRPRRGVSAARGCGESLGFVGSRLAADERIVGEVLAYGEASRPCDATEVEPT